jgi:pyrroline-5-carboxylate reductase
MNRTWGIIGAGQLDACMAKGIHRPQAPLKLCLSPCSELRARALTATFPVTVAENNQAVVDSADHVVLAARPKVIAEIARDLRFRPGQVIVSIARMTRAAASQRMRSGDDMSAMAAEIARPATFTALGLELLDERGALGTWTEACRRVLGVCRESGR